MRLVRERLLPGRLMGLLASFWQPYWTMPYFLLSGGSQAECYNLTSPLRHYSSFSRTA